MVLYLRRQEAKLTHDRLSEYAAVGWFNPDEVPALATGKGRRQAIAWAARSGKGPQMKQYIKDATRLAFARQRIITNRNLIGADVNEPALLNAVVESRKALVGVGTAPAS